MTEEFDPLEQAYLKWLESPDAHLDDGGPSLRETFRAGMIYGLRLGFQTFTSEFIVRRNDDDP